MKNWKPIGDAASNVVQMIRKDKGDIPPEYGVLCEDFGSIVDGAVDENIPPWVVATALLHSIAHLFSQTDGKADDEIELWLLRSVPKIFEWAAKVREEEANNG